MSKAAGAMSGVSRFLSVSKRDKDKHKHHSTGFHLSSHSNPQNTSSTSTVDKTVESTSLASPADFYGLFDDKSKANKVEDSKVESIKQKVLDSKGVGLKDGQVLWALRSQSSKGDVNAAYDLLVAMSDAAEGITTPYNPDVKMYGAVNRQAVTCYLDSTLFAMFSRLDIFEAMLYNRFDDRPRERLAFLFRLWVNLLRSGHLILPDITKEIQDSLAECGWEDAKELHQQDASEAFTFITEKLNLPLLTLKMDIYHTGKQDRDDHKLINERLLEVAIPTLPNGEHPAEIKLEDCLEEYFNNRIEVKRYLERRNTLTSSQPNDSKSKGGNSIHIESVEIDPEVTTPMTPLAPMSSYLAERPTNRTRGQSIIQERFVPATDEKLPDSPVNDAKVPVGRLRTGSIRKEVIMPAWQFFSLIPWYTNHAPSSDAQVAAHFSSKRPVLGLCLKRYSFTSTGRAIRLNTFVDIPLEIGLPHFIQDDKVDEGGPLYGNFKMSLQAVVCHRGNSVNSGHYISLVRFTLPAQGKEHKEDTHWLRFDDLANPRIGLVDIHRALKEETPYLLFYQILPVEGDPGNLTSGEHPVPPDNSSPNLTGTTTLLEPPSYIPPEPLVIVSSTESRPSTRSGRQSLDFLDSRGRSSDIPRRPSAVSFSQLPQPNRTSLDLNREQLPSSSTESSEHKKSGSFNNGLTKTFGILGLRDRRRSREDVSSSIPTVTPQQQQQPPPAQPPTTNSTTIEHKAPDTEFAVNRSTNTTPQQQHHHQQPTISPHRVQLTTDHTRSRSESTNPSRSTSTAQDTAISSSASVSRSRSKRDKSRNRLLRPSGRGKDKDKDSERECVVM